MSAVTASLTTFSFKKAGKLKKKHAYLFNSIKEHLQCGRYFVITSHCAIHLHAFMFTTLWALLCTLTAVTLLMALNPLGHMCPLSH